MEPVRAAARAMVDRAAQTPSRAGSSTPSSRAVAADRPGRGAALGEQLRRHRVLDGLRRLRGVALATERAPGGARELVLAAVAAARGHRGRVAAGLAARDPGERGRGAAARRGGLRGRRGDAERTQRRRAGDAVDREAVGALEAADGAPGHWAEGSVGRHAERALEGGDGAPAGAGLERRAAGARGRGRPTHAVRGDGRAGDERHGREQGAGTAAPDPLSPSLERGLSTTPARGTQRSEPWARVREIEILHSYLLVLAPTGLAVGLARRPALRRAHGGDSPREPAAPIGSPVPRLWSAGIRRITSFRAGRIGT